MSLEDKEMGRAAFRHEVNAKVTRSKLKGVSKVLHMQCMHCPYNSPLLPTRVCPDSACMANKAAMEPLCDNNSRWPQSP